MNPRLMAAVIVSVMVSIFVLAATSAYSAWVTSTNHRNYCARTDLILDTFHDVIQLALTPAPGEQLTAKQVMQIESFENKAFARIDLARC